MQADIDYYFGLSSPWSYMGLRRLREYATRSGSRIHYKPMNVPMLFSETGTLPLGQRPAARQTYRMVELERWRNYLGVTVNLEPKFFPVEDMLAGLVVIAASDAGHDVGELCEMIHQAVWVREQNIADEEVLLSVLRALGLPAEETLADAKSEQTEKQMETLTREAIDKGVFGLPSYVVDGELFWGQDRLEFVGRKLGLHA